VAAGVGIGCLSRKAVAEALAGGWLVEVQTRLPRAARTLSIVVHRERRVGRVAEAFIASCLLVRATTVKGDVPSGGQATDKGAGTGRLRGVEKTKAL